jgi:amino acid transporter
VIATLFTFAVTLGLGFGYDPITAFSMIGTAAVIILAATYIIVSAACIGYFLRHRRADFHPIAHVLVPILSIVAFIPAWLTAAGLPVFSFISKLPPPISYAGPAVAVWMVLGILGLVFLYMRHPERVAEVSRVHLDDPVEDIAEAT